MLTGKSDTLPPLDKDVIPAKQMEKHNKEREKRSRYTVRIGNYFVYQDIGYGRV